LEDFMPWFFRVLPIFASLFAVTMPPSRAGAAEPPAPSVGFQHLQEEDGTDIGIWYPTTAPASSRPIDLYTQEVATDAPVSGHALALIVISHGNGGSYAGHYDTAMALARAGFVVAALTHPGDNWHDQTHATDVVGRPKQLRQLVSYMLGAWSGRAAIDDKRVGAFGFSAGGFTVLAAAGGKPDLGVVRPHCAAHPAFFDCSLIATHPITMPATAPDWPADRRLKAIAVAAPALGFAFDRAGLAGLTIPVQLWRATDDQILPHPFYAEAVATALPSPPDYHLVPKAGHFDFLAPCSAAMKERLAYLCQSAPGFDRTAFHAEFNTALVAFFRKTLR
jgi:predicted dienelactone hydrolase